MRTGERYLTFMQTSKIKIYFLEPAEDKFHKTKKQKKFIHTFPQHFPIPKESVTL